MAAKVAVVDLLIGIVVVVVGVTAVVRSQAIAGKPMYPNLPVIRILNSLVGRWTVVVWGACVTAFGLWVLVDTLR